MQSSLTPPRTLRSPDGSCCAVIGVFGELQRRKASATFQADLATGAYLDWIERHSSGLAVAQMVMRTTCV